MCLAAHRPNRANALRIDLKSLDTFERAVSSAAAHTGRLVSRHPRKITAAVTLALAGFGVTAFGVAPLVPDASDLPKRIVTEDVAPQGVQSQLEALAEHELELYRNDLTRSSDTADTLLRRLNVNDPSAAAFLRTDPIGRKVLEGRSGKMIRVRTDATGQLDELVARYAAPSPDQISTRFTRLRIERVAGRLRATVETAPLAAQVRMGSGTIRSSLFAATDEAGIPDAIATQLAEVFATDIDFHRELRKGATFSVVYEALTADGEPITWNAAVGRVLAAEFVNGGKTYSAMWFKEADGKGAYYGLDGQSKRRSFLASPLEFSRVTSGFAMRMHPILNTWKQHKGVDYGAPTGTPVRAIGDGVVEFAGWQNGYGNVVEIKHSRRALDRVRAPEPHRRRQGAARRSGRAHRRRRPDRLGDRSAPAFRSQVRRRAAGPAAGREVVRSGGDHAGRQGAVRAADARPEEPARSRRIGRPVDRLRRISRADETGPPVGPFDFGGHNSPMTLYIGLMSGTSLDGVDGVLAATSGRPARAMRVLAHAHRAVPTRRCKAELLALNTSGGDELHRAALAANALARGYGDVVEALLESSRTAAAAVRAIGAHGQTVRHRPREFDGTGYTLQLNAPALLAELQRHRRRRRLSQPRRRRGRHRRAAGAGVPSRGVRPHGCDAGGAEHRRHQQPHAAARRRPHHRASTADLATR